LIGSATLSFKKFILNLQGAIDRVRVDVPEQ
jgi:hypothetical protein